MKPWPLLDRLRRPVPRSAPAPLRPPDPADHGEDSVYLAEPPAPDTDPDKDWCVWPAEIDPAVQRRREAATAARDAAVAAAVAAAGEREEDPWAVLHTQRHGTTAG
ncbi:hypothetical protein [Kitasatospora sp. NPDC057223]|uniref:hypothetical protein n=1 Tax=Kitasatospora sp. NPDC057223 TaxID=3346055 RepID=UPI0036282CB1